MSEPFSNLLPSAGALGVAALVALFLTLSRGAGNPDPTERRRTAGIALLAIALQSVHFVEELLTGLDARLPELFGFTPISKAFFMTFNLFWIAVWILSVVGLRARRRAFLFPLWFLGIALVLNGILHPILSLATRGYFPGVWTAPVVGFVGVLLLRRLVVFTRPPTTL